MMSSPEERPSFEEPSPPSGRVQSGFAALFLFESGNNVQAYLPNNNINKGRWTEEEHKIFMHKQWNNLKAILTDNKDGFTDDQWKMVNHLLFSK